MKISFLYIVSFIFLASCTEDSQTEETTHLDTEIKIIELSNQLDDISMTYASYFEISADSSIYDSLKHIELKIKTQLDSIYTLSGLNFEKAELNCINGFGLNVNELNSIQRNFLKLLFGYKICEPRWIACGFTKDSTEEMIALRHSIMSEANNNYNFYIDNLIDQSFNIAFPEIEKKYVSSFYLVAKNYLKQDIFQQSFKDSACDIVTNDSILNKLYAEKEDVRFKELE